MLRTENHFYEKLDTKFKGLNLLSLHSCLLRKERLNLKKHVLVDPKNPDFITIKMAVDEINDCGVLVYPTDSVYGLGTTGLLKEAILKIFKIKNRPLDHPLPLAVSDFDMVDKLAFVKDDAYELMEAFWPGALTIILKKKPIVPDILVGGNKTVGLRMPDHAVPLKIIQLLGVPLVATSANKHGGSNPISATQAIQQIGKEVDLVLDGGSSKGKPSTIIDLTKTPPMILRHGPVSVDLIEKIIGSRVLAFKKFV